MSWRHYVSNIQMVWYFLRKIRQRWVTLWVTNIRAYSIDIVITMIILKDIIWRNSKPNLNPDHTTFIHWCLNSLHRPATMVTTYISPHWTLILDDAINFWWNNFAISYSIIRTPYFFLALIYNTILITWASLDWHLIIWVRHWTSFRWLRLGDRGSYFQFLWLHFGDRWGHFHFRFLADKGSGDLLDLITVCKHNN